MANVSTLVNFGIGDPSDVQHLVLLGLTVALPDVVPVSTGGDFVGGLLRTRNVSFNPKTPTYRARPGGLR